VGRPHTGGNKIKESEAQAMAIPGGYRFRVPFDDVFPQGCYVMSVERARDYNNGKPKDAVDAVSGKPVYAIQVTDPSAKGQEHRLSREDGHRCAARPARGDPRHAVSPGGVH
jgi:hypothetical protein